MPLTRDEVASLARANGRFLKEIIGPIQARIDALEKKLDDQAKTIETLQRQLKLPLSVPVYLPRPGESAS